MAVKRRSGMDRRSGEDRRKVYSFDYFAGGGKERRRFRDRRSRMERRRGWVRVTEWSSAPTDPRRAQSNNYEDG